MDLEPIYSWTKDYFLSNEEKCKKKLKEGLSFEEKIELRSNLHFKENSLVLLNHFMVTDIKEPEFYCAKYEVKQSDGTVSVRNGKYSDKLNIADNETCEDPGNNLAERQICFITESDTNNSWIKDYNAVSTNSNKRKIENVQSEKSYLIKIYDTTEIKLNDFVEVIGFLNANTRIQNEESMEQDNENAETLLPAYTIHAISFREMYHNNPIIINEPENSQQYNQSLEEIRQDLMKLFTQFLFGDQVSAHYLMCHLISTIYSRVNEEALGKFTLNLITQAVPSEVMTEYVKKLYNLFEILLPNSMYFPMSLEKLNTSILVPKKNYVTNNLSPALLQLPKNTHILLDETKLENGKLEQTGCVAIQQLSELIRTQQLNYDFQFYNIPFKTDYPVLIISEGKSLLPSDFAIPIKPVDTDSVRLINEHFAAGIHYMRPKLNAYRRFLTNCRLQPFLINDREISMIESDFVRLREDYSNFQIENLHSLLVLSRLLGISKGLKQLDAESWNTAKRIELERTNRMEKRTVNEP